MVYHLTMIEKAETRSGYVDGNEKSKKKKAVEAHRAVRRRGFHIFSRQSAHRWR
jgi:hypothetical protein